MKQSNTISKEFKPPYYPLIEVKGGYVAVNKAIGLFHNHTIIYHKDRGITKNTTHRISDDEFTIIAHTGIESLKDSGLPMINIGRISDSVRVYAIKKYRHYGSGCGVLAASAYLEGYVTAGGYTEEEIDGIKDIIANYFKVKPVGRMGLDGNDLAAHVIASIKTVNTLKRKPIAVKLSDDFKTVEEVLYHEGM